jgi:hypothetical protein
MKFDPYSTYNWYSTATHSPILPELQLAHWPRWLVLGDHINHTQYSELGEVLAPETIY